MLCQLSYLTTCFCFFHSLCKCRFCSFSGISALPFVKKKLNNLCKVYAVGCLGVFVILVVIWIFISHSMMGLLEKNRGWWLLHLHTCFPQPGSYTSDCKTQQQLCSSAQSCCNFPGLHEILVVIPSRKCPGSTDMLLGCDSIPQTVKTRGLSPLSLFIPFQHEKLRKKETWKLTEWWMPLSMDPLIAWCGWSAEWGVSGKDLHAHIYYWSAHWLSKFHDLSAWFVKQHAEKQAITADKKLVYLYLLTSLR